MINLTIEPKRSYSIAEAAALVGIDRHTLLRHAKDELIAYRISKASGRKRFLGADIIRYRDHIL